MIVKIDNPKGSYYGGHTAAPVTRTMLQQALASRRVAIDRGRLAPGEAGTIPAPAAAIGPTARPITVVSWPYQGSGQAVGAGDRAERGGTVGSRSRARPAPAGVPHEPSGNGAGRADGS